jgi:hypothetical protein
MYHLVSGGQTDGQMDLCWSFFHAFVLASAKPKKKHGTTKKAKAKKTKEKSANS